jgi:hypothetical protein
MTADVIFVRSLCRMLFVWTTKINQETGKEKKEKKEREKKQ